MSTDDYFQKNSWNPLIFGHLSQKSLQLRLWTIHSGQPRGTEFSAYDAEGVPTHDKDGNALPKSAIKKLAKDLGGFCDEPITIKT